MPTYEYKVVPAPVKGQKAKGVKTPQGRFALSVEEVLNRMGAEGWEYQRAELLPSEERTGLTGSATHWRNLLVFRRALGGSDQRDSMEAETPSPSLLAIAAAQAGAQGTAQAPAATASEAEPAVAERRREPPLYRLEDAASAAPEPAFEPDIRPAFEAGDDDLPEDEDEPEALEDGAEDAAEDAEEEEQLMTGTDTLTGIERVVRRNSAHKDRRR